MDARTEIAAAARPPVRSRGPDYLGLLNDCLSAWDFAGAVLGGLAATRLFLALGGHDAALGAPGSALREVLFGSLLAAVVLRDRRLVSPAGYASVGLLVRRLLVRLGLVAALLVGVGFATRSLDDASRLWVVLWAVPVLGAALLGRLVLLVHVRRLLRRGALRSVVAVVGEREAALRVMHSLSHPGSGIELLGPFGGGADDAAWSAGSVDDLVRLAQRHGAPDRVIVAAPAGPAGMPGIEMMPGAGTRRGAAGLAGAGDLATVVRRLRELPAEISLCPPLPPDDAGPRERERASALIAGLGLDGLGRTGLHLGGAGAGLAAGYGALDRLPLLRVAERPLAAWGGVAKHATDKAVAAAAIVLLSPLLLAIALAVRLDSAGPAIFRQERDGWNGRRFTVLKFRTMRAAPPAAGLLQTARGDARCTRLGRFLRRSSLDELPQLLNVLCGDMSLVGPRPHATCMRTEDRLCHEIIAEYAQRHRVRPGLTGLAQVSGLRGATHTVAQLRARVECDLDYIERWSFGLDLRILALTAVKVFSAAGAF